MAAVTCAHVRSCELIELKRAGFFGSMLIVYNNSCNEMDDAFCAAAEYVRVARRIMTLTLTIYGLDHIPGRSLIRVPFLKKSVDPKKYF